MIPKELRAFREGIGMSRREFAARIFTSEATLERWERGQGQPRAIHLLILNQMREQLGGGHMLLRFQYDRSADVPVEKAPDHRRTIIDTLGQHGAVFLEECKRDARGDWVLRFMPDWAKDEPIDLVLACEGSEHILRPSIDFILRGEAKAVIAPSTVNRARRICHNHGIAWQPTVKGKSTMLEFASRTFNTGCNPEVIRLTYAGLRSCWRRVRRVLF